MLPDCILLLTLVGLCCLLTLSCQQKLIIVDGDHGDDKSCINSGTREGGGHPCRTLYQALKGITDNNTLVHILNGTYPHNTTDTTLTFSNVSITGDGADVTIVQCDHGSGFGFLNATNVSISGLTVLGCGQLRNSTTRNISSQSTLQFRAALYYLNVKGVNIDDVVVNNSTGMGVAMYDVNGSVSVTNSIFSNNAVPNNELLQYPGGGGFSVEFTYCKPGVTGLPNTSCNSSEVHASSSYTFYNCIFRHNSASSVHTKTTTYANTAYGFGNQQFGRGGGLSVFFRGVTTNNTITIDYCYFIDNCAIWGAGFHSDIVDSSSKNNLYINNSVFTDNACHMNDALLSVNTGGGGMRIALLFSDARSRLSVTSNHVTIEQCIFTNNLAYYGGGVSYRITKEDAQASAVATNFIQFINCTWNGNRARTGSGIDIAAHPFPLGITPVAIINNCTFKHNSNQYSNSTQTPVGIGAIYSDNFPVKFTGQNVFIHNTGSALAGSATHFVFSNSSRTTFHHNVGTNGGAIALLGNAFLIMGYNANLNFTANQAHSKGGAIYYVSNSERDFISTQKCFMFYYDTSADQSKWNTSLQFENNFDLKNKSLFTTTLLPCVWGNLPGSSNISLSTIASVFNGTFHYNDDPHSVTANNSITDAINIIHEHSPVQIPPGKLYPLNITSWDEVGNEVNPVFFVQTLNSTVSLVDNTTKYISDNKVKLFGVLRSKFSLQLQTVNGRPWSLIINVTLSDCPPGFYYSIATNTTVPHNGTYGKCICSTNSYYGLYQCDQTELVAYMHSHFWGGIMGENESLQFVTADCPVGYCTKTNAYYQLPEELSKEADMNISNTQCYNRHRRLCGRCKQGYYVSTNFPTFECYKCDHNDTSLNDQRIISLILLKYVPLTIFMLVIIFFNISLVNGPLNSYILFSQIINSEGLYANGNITGLSEDQQQNFYSAYYFPYGLWNSNFFEVLIPKFCAFRVDTTMTVLLYEYIPAFYPVVLFILFYSVIPWLSNCLVLSNSDVLRRCILKAERMFIVFRRSWSVKNSIIHGLTTFLVLSYAKVTVVTSLLLASTTLYGANGTSHGVVTVARLDGTMHYLHKQHAPYAAVAFVFLFSIVLLPPLLLLSYPLLPNLIAKLNCQDKWVFKKLIIKPLDKCAPFFDAFQGCYKDNYRFFAGLYFLYRAMALAVLTFTHRLAARLIYQQGFYLSIMSIHYICQPYRKKRYNILDGFIFAILVATNGLALYNLFSVEVYLSTPQTSLWIQLILLYVPLTYFLAFVSYHTIKWCFPRVNRAKVFLLRFSASNYHTVPTEDDDTVPARLLDTDDSSNSGSEDEDVGDNNEQGNHVDDQDDYDNVVDDNDNKQSNHIDGERVVEMNLPVQWNGRPVSDDSSPTGSGCQRKYHNRFTT